MKKLMAVTMLVMLALTVSYAGDTLNKDFGKIDDNSVMLPPTAAPVPVNQMINVNAINTPVAPIATTPAPIVAPTPAAIPAVAPTPEPAVAQGEKAKGDETGDKKDKETATWTNPKGKTITNHGMAKKLENQKKKEARKEAKQDAKGKKEAAVDVKKADKDAPVVTPVAPVAPAGNVETPVNFGDPQKE